MKTAVAYALLAILVTTVIGYCAFNLFAGVHEVLMEITRALSA